MSRVHNFSAGPAQLPLEVLNEAKGELTDYHQKGRSVMEMSHRGDEYTEIDRQAKQRIRSLMDLGDDFHIMFLQGGASSQFMMVPFNFLNENQTADYIDTGRWSTKAIKEAQIFGQVNIPYTGKDVNFAHVPTQDELSLSSGSQYVHYTSNNTVAGSQFQYEPETGDTPLVCDASSDILSRSFDTQRYGLIYAGAQKNMGPAGVTVVIVKRSFLDQAKSKGIPTMLQYKTHAKRIFNTPPVFNVYIMNLVLKWVEDQGGVSHFEALSKKKANLLYDEIDRDNFYQGAVDEQSRSAMNVTFRLPNKTLLERFIDEAAERNLVGLRGHRSVGGIRASIYNACPLDSVKTLADLMNDFRGSNG